MNAATIAAGQTLSLDDVCLTQVGNSTPPLIYPNIAQLNQAQESVATVKICGANAINTSASIASSVTGPGAGILQGVESGTVNGKCTFTAGSGKVNINGHPAVRLNDATSQNNGNCDGTVAVPSQVKVMING